MVLPLPLTRQVAQEISPVPDSVIGPLAETATVPDALGSVMVLFCVGSVTARVVVNALSVAP